MCPPDPDSSSRRRLARFTPDSRRWRYTLAGLNAVAAPILLYYTARLISSTWSGTLPSLLVLVGAVLTLASAAAAPTLLLAPEGEEAQNTSESEDDAIAELKRRYASGEVPEAEFERRLETLMEASTDEERWPSGSGRDRGVDRASTEVDSEFN